MSKRSSRLLRVVLCAALAFWQIWPSAALAQSALQDLQSIGGSSSLQQYLNQLNTSPNAASTPQTQSQQTVLTPLPMPAISSVPSALEARYYQRTGVPLRQFGYDIFGGASSAAIPQGGGVQDNYILGPGDEVIINLRGQANQTFDVRVNSNGQIILPKLAPISAAGRSFGDVRRDIEAQVGKAYIATKAYVSVGQIRQISVLVAGEVNRPGAINLTALNSPMDALLLAGGVKKTGSLRAIHILRDGKEIPVDLYGVLAGLNVSVPRSLMQGDTIIVPPVGATVAVTGEVNRPAIYELAPGKKSISAEELIHLAGNYLRAGAHRLTVTRIKPDGNSVLEHVKTLAGVVLHKSEVLSVQPESDVSLGRVVLEGQVRAPGTYDLSRVSSLHALVGNPSVYDERPYMAYAVISRRDPKTLVRRLIAFAPSEVLAGRFDLPLRDDDIVHIFSVDQARTLAAYLASLGPTAAELGQETAQSGQTASSTLGPTTAAQAAKQMAPQPLQPSQMNQQPPEAPSQSATTMTQSFAPSTALQALAGMSPAQQQQALSQMAPAQRQAALADLAQGPNAPASASSVQQPQSTGQALAPGNQAYPNQYPGQPANPYGAGAGQMGAYQPYQGGTSRPSQPYAPGNDALNFPPKSTNVTSSNLFLDLNDPAVQSQMATHIVSLLGAVEVPGEYLAAPGVSLATLVDAAGGLKITVDLTNIEVTSTTFNSETGSASTKRTDFDLPHGQLSRIKIQPDDVIRFREVFSQRDNSQVSIAGQVKYPGTFDLLRGERLSSLLARAGGLTNVAYPLGAVFLRQSVAQAEQQGYRRTAKELEAQVPLLATDPNANPTAIQFIQNMINKLETAQGAGRIVVDANPADLVAHPERDLVLEPGDYLMIPRRPNTVSVSGEVLSEGSYLYRGGADAHYYVNLAGGYSPGADEAHAFILLPDGSARPLRTSLLRFGRSPIIPGSTIVVPRNIRPFRFRQFALDLTQIASQLAISAASLSVVSKNTQ